jgi:glycosyltransferase involved in cell wall biosynthesis
MQHTISSNKGIPTKQRRVLILSEIIAPYRIPVFNALARDERVDLHVVFLSETDAGLRQWRVYKDEIQFSYEVLPSTRLRVGKSSLLLNWRLRSRLEKFAPSAIICGGYNYVASWEALWWAKNHGTEMILWSESNRHDARSGRRLQESLKSYFLSHCDRFVVPGRASREYLQSLGVAAQHISTAPNAVDNGWFQAQADAIRTQPSDFRRRFALPQRFLLFVGRLVPEKGVFDLLDAYAKLEDDVRSEVGLVFVGDGPSRPELERRARSIRLGDIRFPGFLHREDIAGLYALAEVFILPTQSDPWGLVVNEAMACGLPVIVSNVAGCASDLVEDGRNGLIVPARNSDKLRAAIDFLLRTNIGQQLGERSLGRIQRYSPQACAEGLAAGALAQTSEVQWMTG